MPSNIKFPQLERKPLKIVISGLSGAGKDTVVNALRARGIPFFFVVTTTSREKREGEVEGRDYFFISKTEFERMIAADELLEYSVVYDDYKGIPREQVRKALESGQDMVMRLDVQGAEKVKKALGDVLMIFITVESGEELERRLRRRESEPADKQALRIATARHELSRLGEFDYVVVNLENDIEKTVDQIQAILEAEHLRNPEHRADF